jgi:hypothetical protein
LKGLIVSNAVTDYRSDPNIFTMKVLNEFNAIPNSLYEEYQNSNCTIPWTLLWNDLKIIPYPELNCIKMFAKAANMRGYNVYNVL